MVLGIVMDYTKEIRPGYKKRVKTGVKTPINRRPGWGPGGSVVCWRMVWPAVVDGWRLMLQAGGCLPFWAPERQGGRAAAGGGAVGGIQGGGAMVCRGWPSGWPAWQLLVVCRGWLGRVDDAGIWGNDPAAIRRYLISH